MDEKTIIDSKSWTPYPFLKGEGVEKLQAHETLYLKVTGVVVALSDIWDLNLWVGVLLPPDQELSSSLHLIW